MSEFLSNDQPVESEVKSQTKNSIWDLYEDIVNELSKAEQNLAWHERANCTGNNDLFFSDDRADVYRARIICQSCAVREKCLEYALEIDEVVGVWGGLDSQQIQQLRFERYPKLKRREADRRYRLKKKNGKAKRLQQHKNSDSRQSSLKDEQIHLPNKNKKDLKTSNKKESQGGYSRQYYQDNKERIQELKTLRYQMPGNKDKTRQYNQQYYRKHKKAILEKKREDYHENKDEKRDLRNENKKRQQERFDRLSPQEKIKELESLERKKKQKQDYNRQYYQANKEIILRKKRENYHKNKK